MDIVNKRSKLEKFRDLYLDLILEKGSAKDIKNKASTLSKSEISGLCYFAKLLFTGKLTVPKNLFLQIRRRKDFIDLEKIVISKETKKLYDQKTLQKYLPILCHLLEVLM